MVFEDSTKQLFTNEQLQTLSKVLALDPRPHYHHDDQRIYGMPYAGFDIRFRVADGVLTVTEVKQ